MIRGFLSTLFGRKQADQEIDAELRFHLEARAEALRGHGLSAAEAQRRARLEFGGFDTITEECRDSRPARWLHDLLQDLDYAWRMMKKSPVVSTAAVVSLALGIGANTAIFSLMDAILLRELPVERPGELVVLNWQAAQRGHLFERYAGSIRPPGMTGNAFSYAAFEALHQQPEIFAQLATYLSVGRFSVAANGVTHAISGQLVSGDYFPLLGVRPLHGRLLQSADDRPDAPLAVVVSHRFWERALGADPVQIGKVVRVNNVAATVIGVAAPEFFGHEVGAHPDIALSLAHVREVDPEFVAGMESPFTNRTSWTFQMLGRLRDPQASLPKLEARLTPLLVGTLESAPAKPGLSPRLILQPAARGISGLRRGIDTTFTILLGSTLLVLLIASANVANLLLARAMGRQREIAVRLSMGASRGRLWRQILSEFLLLAGLVTLFPSRGTEEIAIATSVDWRLLLATSAVALLITFIFGAIPAWRATRLDVTGSLKENAGSLRAGTSQVRGRIGKFMIAGQVALSLLLFAGAGMFVRTLVNLKSVDLGFARERLVMFTLNSAQVGYGDDQRAAFYDRTTKELESVGGVESVSASMIRPLMGGGYWDDVNSPKFNIGGRKSLGVGIHLGLPHFASTLGVQVLSGRDLDERDGSTAPRVMVVNETMANTAFGGRNPVGEMVTLGDHKPVPYQIVGLVRDARYDRIREHTPTVYVAAAQREKMPEQMTFVVRTRGASAALIPLLRQAVARVEPNIPLFQLRTLDQQIDDSLRTERMYAMLCGVFAGLALILSAVGIFGVMAYQAGRRRQEIGVRLALGAGRDRVVAMVLRESILTVIAGIVAGLPLAYFLPKLVNSLLYGLQATDPGIFLTAILVLLVTAIAAAWIPAWRAARLDPMMALREE
jgi:predicted permease